jgi:hypothetical protein
MTWVGRSESHDGEQPARLAPALADLRGGVEGRDGHAPGAARDEDRHRDWFTRTKDGAVEGREDFGCGHFVGGRSAADALAKRAGVVAVGDAKARLHQRRDPLQIRRCVDGHGEPLRLRLLQREIPGHDLGDTARFGLRDPVAVKQGVGRDGDEADGRKRRDAQCQPQLQIDGGRAARHGVGCLSQAFSSSFLPSASIVRQISPGRKRGRRAGQGRVFHPAVSGKAAVSAGQQIGRCRND